MQPIFSVKLFAIFMEHFELFILQTERAKKPKSSIFQVKIMQKSSTFPCSCSKLSDLNFSYFCLCGFRCLSDMFTSLCVIKTECSLRTGTSFANSISNGIFSTFDSELSLRCPGSFKKCHQNNFQSLFFVNS